jgi:hypothetical protein
MMNQSKETKDRVPLPEQRVCKKIYEKPRIIYRAPLEAMASVCVPRPPGKSIAGLCTILFS